MEEAEAPSLSNDLLSLEKRWSSSQPILCMKNSLAEAPGRHEQYKGASKGSVMLLENRKVSKELCRSTNNLVSMNEVPQADRFSDEHE